MRPLLITDEAHLKGTYKGTKLVLVGMDGNNQIIPIATGVSQGETGESWRWFLLKFKECIVYILEDMQSNTPEEFQRRISNLRGLRPEAYQKLKDDGFKTWSRAMCPSNRYNYMTSNSAELINNLSRHVRKAPITMLIEWYRALLQKWYCARREKYQDSSVHTLSDWATHKVMDKMEKSANWKVYGIHQAVGRVMGCTDYSDMTLVVKPPNMNFPKAGRPKNTDRIKSQDEEPIQVRCSRCGVRGHTRTSCHEPIPNYQESTQSSWKRSRQARPESNIHNNFGGRSQQYEAAYSNNHGRSLEYAQAYNNMIGRSQEYDPAYTKNHRRSQEYEPVYNNMIRRSQDYEPAYNNNGRSQEYKATYNNINFSGMAQDPHPTMPFAFNQFNFGQTSQQTDSPMSFTWDSINLAEP
ncbi:transposase, MuDR, MULE transposase domain protein [Tanacetum coccineum]